MQSQALKLGQKLMKRCQELGLSVKDFMRIGEETYLEAMKKEEPIYLMSEEEVDNRIRILGIDRPELKIFGVGWGGYCACHYLQKAQVVLKPEDADFLLITIIKDEKSLNKYKKVLNNKPFFALVDQSKPWKSTSKVKASFEAFKNPEFGNCIELADHQIEGRIVFPWEQIRMKETKIATVSETNLFPTYQMLARLAIVMKVCLPIQQLSTPAIKDLEGELETIQTWATRLMDEGIKKESDK